jgi:Na+/H+ antiporter
MQQVVIQYILIILLILMLVMLARKLRIAYPIVLVLGGLVLSQTGGFEGIDIDPDMIFFIFLPPLLYEAAWQTSWKQFWKFRRVIMSFAFPVVLITSCVVAFVSNAFIPGFTLALGFLLGGIVSPPDAISATTIMRNVKAPRSLVSIIEGESLLNDASSLIVFRFAMAAVVTGQFVFRDAAVNFFVVIIMGTLIGLAVGLFFYAVHRWLPTTSSMDIVLSFVTPYCMYYFAERFHFSGVLAVVSGGLFLASQKHRMLTHASRVEGANVWSMVGFVLNGIIFFLIGLELPVIVDQLENISVRVAIGYGLLVSGVLIVTRVITALGAAAFTRFISRFITVADPNPGWRAPLVVGWAGMRGVVSLAAALSIPVLLDNGDVFPQRNLILFITFVVILVTLVCQGLSLPWIIRKLNPRERILTIPEDEQEELIRKKLVHYSVQLMQERYGVIAAGNDGLKNILDHLKTDLELQASDQKKSIALELLEEQRKLLHKMNRKLEFDEELIRKHLTLIDLEETKLRT